jgi:hypothetical protein
VSFVVRAALLLQLLTSVNDEGPRAWAWLLHEEWAPATLPALGLLYLMRDARNAGPEAMRHTSAAAAPGLADDSSTSDRLWAEGSGNVEMAAHAARPPAVGAGDTPPRPPTLKGPGQYQLVDEAMY